MAHFCSIINKFLLLQYSEEICSVSTRAVVLKVSQNDHGLTLFLTRIKLGLQWHRTLGNKRMNIETIQNG